MRVLWFTSAPGLTGSQPNAAFVTLARGHLSFTPNPRRHSRARLPRAGISRTLLHLLPLLLPPFFFSCKQQSRVVRRCTPCITLRRLTHVSPRVSSNLRRFTSPAGCCISNGLSPPPGPHLFLCDLQAARCIHAIHLDRSLSSPISLRQQGCIDSNRT